MKYIGQFKYISPIKLTASLLLLTLAYRSEAQQYLVGVRGGASLDDDPGYFRQAEAFVGAYLPWTWNTYCDVSLKPRVELSAGGLSGGGRDGFVGTLGPVIELRVGKFPVTLEGGVSPTILSRFEFCEKDLGGRVEFTDHAGLNWHIDKNFTLGWRFQHMSNAGIYRRNPGLNLQMLSLSYSF